MGAADQPGARILFDRLARQITPPRATPKLDRDERRRRVAALRAQGMSHRMIAAELGVSKATVATDLEHVTSFVPAEVIGVGGKRYPSRRPSAKGRMDPLVSAARHRRRERERYHNDPECRERINRRARERYRARAGRAVGTTEAA